MKMKQMLLIVLMLAVLIYIPLASAEEIIFASGEIINQGSCEFDNENFVCEQWEFTNSQSSIEIKNTQPDGVILTKVVTKLDGDVVCEQDLSKSMNLRGEVGGVELSKYAFQFQPECETLMRLETGSHVDLEILFYVIESDGDQGIVTASISTELQKPRCRTDNINVKCSLWMGVGKARLMIKNIHPDSFTIKEASIKWKGETVCQADNLNRDIYGYEMFKEHGPIPIDIPCQIDFDEFMRTVQEEYHTYDIPLSFELKMEEEHRDTAVISGTANEAVNPWYCYLESSHILCDGPGRIEGEDMFMLNFHPDGFEIKSLRLKSGDITVCENKNVDKVFSGFPQKDYGGTIKFKCNNLDKVQDKIIYYGLNPTLELDIELDAEEPNGDTGTIKGKLAVGVEQVAPRDENCYFNSGILGCKSYKISSEESFIKLVNFHSDGFKVTGINLDYDGVSCSAEDLNIDVSGRGNNFLKRLWSLIKIKVFRQSTKISFDCQGLELHKGEELTFLMELDVEESDGDKGIITGKLKARI